MLLKACMVVHRTFLLLISVVVDGSFYRFYGNWQDGDEEGIEEEQEELPQLSSFQDMWTESQVSESNALRVLL